jgi:hypothetical protein
MRTSIVCRIRLVIPDRGSGYPIGMNFEWAGLVGARFDR